MIPFDYTLGAARKPAAPAAEPVPARAAEPETVTIDGTVYTVDRDVSDFNDDADAPSRAICWLTASRGTRTLIVRDQIAHGAFVASGSTRLERTPSHRIRQALETVFGPFPTITARGKR